MSMYKNKHYNIQYNNTETYRSNIDKNGSFGNDGGTLQGMMINNSHNGRLRNGFMELRFLLKIHQTHVAMWIFRK